MMNKSFNMNSPIPVLRIFDETKAKEFYTNFLEFHVNWEHRNSEESPLYMQISRSGCILHLSEYYGDGCPGANIRIEVDQLDQLQSTLLSKNYAYCRPGIETTPWNTREVRVGDPFGNRIVFYEHVKE